MKQKIRNKNARLMSFKKRGGPKNNRLRNSKVPHGRRNQFSEVFLALLSTRRVRQYIAVICAVILLLLYSAQFNENQSNSTQSNTMQPIPIKAEKQIKQLDLTVFPKVVKQIQELPAMPKIVHVVWPDKNVVSSSHEMIQQGIHQFVELSPEWELRIHDYEDMSRRFEQTSLLSKEDKAMMAKAHVEERTNAFRLLLIYEVGGLWIDIDRVVNRPLSEIIESDTKMMLPTYYDINFARDLFASSPGNPLIFNAMNYQWALLREKPRKHGVIRSKDLESSLRAFSWSLELDLFGHILVESEWNDARRALKELGSLIVTTKDVWCDGMLVTPFDGCKQISSDDFFDDYGIMPWAERMDATWNE